jgi:glycosyltransferase involved in cell wall biosynthesis
MFLHPAKGPETSGFGSSKQILRRLAYRAKESYIAHMSSDFDIIHVVAVPSLALIRQIRSHSKARIVYDLCDAAWQPYYNGHEQINQILSSVDAVTNDNEYGLAYASRFNSSVFLWPPPSQVEMFDRFRGQPKPSVAGGHVTIGWIGSNSTAFNLYRIWEALEEIFQRHPHLQLRLVGVDPDSGVLPRFEHVSFSARPHYTPEQMVEEVLRMDIGIYPLFATDNSRVRGILKALIYMSGEVAVVCCPVGECARLVKDGENGLLANSTGEWIEKLDRLITDRQLRCQLTAAGLETVRSGYTLEKSLEYLRVALGV